MNVEPSVIDGSTYSIRHVGPRARVWPECPTADFTLLGRTDMVARPLRMSALPSSPDFVSGSWTGRLGDNGEASLTFPNTVSSDGIPYRSRFDPSGHCEFLEIRRNGELDFVGVIDQIPTVDQTQVQVHCSDGWFLLKKAYTRDWTVTQAPRDVIEHATRVWVPVAADNFAAGSPNPNAAGSRWSADGGGTLDGTSGTAGTATIGPSGGLVLSAGGASFGCVEVFNTAQAVGATKVWRVMGTMTPVATSGTGIRFAAVENGTEHSGSPIQHEFNLNPTAGNLTLILNSVTVSTTTVPTALVWNFLLESDGEWIWAFLNGQLLTCVRRSVTDTTSLVFGAMLTQGAGTSGSVTIPNLMAETLQPFLMPGTDDGDYLLPGEW